MDSNTARSVLDLPRNGSLDEDDIQEAFREKSKEYHPDTSDLSNAREKFLEVKKAREVLLAAGTTQSSQSSSSTTQSSTSRSSNPNRNSADKQSSTSDPGSRSRTGNRTRTSQSGWQKETSSWASDGNTGGDWRADKASSSTREKESKGSSETHQRNQSSSKTETESEGESTGGRTKIHQQAWESGFS
jgi:DnaJ-class molecular chaperone